MRVVVLDRSLVEMVAKNVDFGAGSVPKYLSIVALACI